MRILHILVTVVVTLMFCATANADPPDTGKAVINVEVPPGTSVEVRVNGENVGTVQTEELNSCERAQAKGYLIWCAPKFKAAVGFDEDPWSTLEDVPDSLGGATIDTPIIPRLDLGKSFIEILPLARPFTDYFSSVDCYDLDGCERHDEAAYSFLGTGYWP